MLRPLKLQAHRDAFIQKIELQAHRDAFIQNN